MVGASILLALLNTATLSARLDGRRPTHGRRHAEFGGSASPEDAIIRGLKRLGVPSATVLPWISMPLGKVLTPGCVSS